MLEMKRLRLLWELDARGTVAAVAEALRYSPSAISQQLALLEREAGVTLLRRVGRTLELTAAAQALVAETQELLAGLERAEAALHRAHAEVSGTVRLAVFQTALLALMPQVLRRLRAAHPRLRVEMVQHEPEAGLEETRARAFDLVVAEQYPGHSAPHFSGLDREPLVRDHIRLGLPPLDAGDPEFDRVERLQDAAGLPWVMEPEGAASRHWALQLCRSAGFEPDVRYETADLQTHVRLIETGNAVALLPDLVHRGAIHQLRLVSLKGDPQRTVFTAARSSSGIHPALEAVRHALHEEAAALDEVE
ncbi:LysR family transcriptional regulator [Leucobacter coleopterorum]|uniref:LysR family transcriptional regulator n=1 Tax=Leucobacter coleopterorum TaxID=2714933 RepID=A0ABX6JV69_9MICO|nr:LysR family transcriptional regulator [Leucobacter coleopterorum]QIM18204.1 LysR family transcriptional regulator [Leucobacter coleopterorum]